MPRIDPRTREVIRCPYCSHAIGTSSVPMQIVGVFRPAFMGLIPPAHTEEKRLTCRSCRWVSVYHPTHRAREAVVLK